MYDLSCKVFYNIFLYTFGQPYWLVNNQSLCNDNNQQTYVKYITVWCNDIYPI